MTPNQNPLFNGPSKYLDVILGAWGGWDLFQSLLSVLRIIGDRHDGLSISNVATRWVLDHSFVAAVIVGECVRTCTLSMGFVLLIMRW